MCKARTAGAAEDVRGETALSASSLPNLCTLVLLCLPLLSTEGFLALISLQQPGTRCTSPDYQDRDTLLQGLLSETHSSFICLVFTLYNHSYFLSVGQTHTSFAGRHEENPFKRLSAHFWRAELQGMWQLPPLYHLQGVCSVQFYSSCVFSLKAETDIYSC